MINKGKYFYKTNVRKKYYMANIVYFKYYREFPMGDWWQQRLTYLLRTDVLNDKRRGGAMTWCHNPSPFAEIPLV